MQRAFRLKLTGIAIALSIAIVVHAAKEKHMSEDFVTSLIFGGGYYLFMKFVLKRDEPVWSPFFMAALFFGLSTLRDFL